MPPCPTPPCPPAKVSARVRAPHPSPSALYSAIWRIHSSSRQPVHPSRHPSLRLRSNSSRVVTAPASRLGKVCGVRSTRSSLLGRRSRSLRRLVSWVSLIQFGKVWKRGSWSSAWPGWESTCACVCFLLFYMYLPQETGQREERNL